ncbi:MAG: GNAT family N-acetyltransferase [Acetivibrionales bacterium]
MYSLRIGNDTVCLKDITIEQLPVILEWYNRTESFRFATGIEKPINLEFLIQKYTETAICSREFFAGVYVVAEDKMIGVLKGRLHDEKKGTLWLNSIAIAPEYQNMGYGSKAVELLLGHFRQEANVKKVYIAVAEKNTQGRLFWIKQDFKELKRIENYIRLANNNYWNGIIMYRNLDS